MSAPALDGELEVAILAARAAGDLLKVGFERPVRASRKGERDVVTAWDHRAESEIMGSLARAFPGDRRLGEESGLAEPVRGTPDGLVRTWIVDPLDGTVNFASGIPFWCVSIALAIGDDVVLGVIRDPLRSQTYAAIRGTGAWRLEQATPLGVRRVSRIADAVLDAGPGDPDDPHAVERIAIVQSRVRAVRALGSIALSLTLLAAGRLDGVLQVRGLEIVDVAAAGLLATEAGARVTDADGGPWLRLDDLGRRAGVAAARPGIHRVLVGSAIGGVPT